MIYLSNGCSGDDAARILKIQADAQKVEAERAKQVRAQIRASQQELEEKKRFNARPDDEPPVTLAPGQIDVGSIKPGANNEAARDQIARLLDKRNSS
jgi:hypothetical protein